MPSGDLLENQALDDPLGSCKAAVQIGRCQNGFHRIGHNAVAVASAALLLSVSQEEKLSQSEAGCRLGQAALTHQVSTDSREVALRAVRQAAVQGICHHKAQNAVAQKLQAFVAAAAVPPLVGIGAVGQRIFQKRLVLEVIAQAALQFFIHVYIPLYVVSSLWGLVSWFKACTCSLSASAMPPLAASMA